MRQLCCNTQHNVLNFPKRKKRHRPEREGERGRARKYRGRDSLKDNFIPCKTGGGRFYYYTVFSIKRVCCKTDITLQCNTGGGSLERGGDCNANFCKSWEGKNCFLHIVMGEELTKETKKCTCIFSVFLQTQLIHFIPSSSSSPPPHLKSRLPFCVCKQAPLQLLCSTWMGGKEKDRDEFYALKSITCKQSHNQGFVLGLRRLTSG